MKIVIIVLVTLLGAATAKPQYTYPRPTTTERPFEGYRYPKPQVTYLPPPPPTTPPPPVYVTERVISPVYSAPEEEYQGGAAYDFTYSVKDGEYNNDYMRNEQSDGNVIRGEYRTLLPDGRMQIVKYTADWRNGFNADVSYIGEARYDP